MPLPPLKNLSWLKSLSLPDSPDFGTKLSEMIVEMQQGIGNIAQQTNSNPTGDPLPPPPVNGLNVTANNGHFQVAINHEGAEFYRGIKYYVDHSDNPQFTNAHTVELGAARNANLFLGNSSRYFRAYAAYTPSQPGPVAYHGGAQPTPVLGGGAIPGPRFQLSEGSGTGTRGVSHSGPGPVPFRTRTGGPPTR